MEQLQGYFWGFRTEENPNIPFSSGATEHIRPLSLLVTLPLLSHSLSPLLRTSRGPGPLLQTSFVHRRCLVYSVVVFKKFGLKFYTSIFKCYLFSKFNFGCLFIYLC